MEQSRKHRRRKSPARTAPFVSEVELARLGGGQGLTHRRQTVGGWQTLGASECR